MRIAFIDLETTGLPRQPKFNVYYDYTELKHYEEARIVQVSLIVCDVNELKIDEHKQVSENTYIIKPDGFEIKNSQIHKISNAMALFAGIPFKEVAEKLFSELSSCSILIAHNIIFDRNILLSELHRYGCKDMIEHINSMKYFCTSRGCKNITKIRFNAKEMKQPKLSELYKFVFKKEMIDGHDALIDTKALVDIFMEMRKRRLVVYFDGKFRASCDL